MATLPVAYSESFKRKLVQRMLGPNPLTATALSHEVQVPQNTLSRWLREASTLPPVSSHEPPSSAPAPRSAQDKLRLLLAYEALPESDRGAWLRREGLHDSELTQWRQAMVEALDESTPEAPPKGSSKRIRQLERELRRKEKALAEAAALLILQKKVRALWEAEDDDTPEESDS